MLCPNVMNTSDLLATAYTNVLKIKKYVYASSNIEIATIQQEPNWLTNVRSITITLRNACTPWSLKKPDVWSNILVQFSNYTNTFYGIGQDEWIDVLSQRSIFE